MSDVSPVPPTAELDWRDFYDRAAKIANTYHEISVMKHGELVEKLPLLENSLSLLNGWMASALSGANADRDHLLAENKRLRNFCTGQTPGISGTPRTITRRFMFPQPLVKENEMKCPNRQFDIHQVGSIESCSVCNHYNGTERTVADLTAELERVQKQSDRWRDEKHKADDLLYRANERAEKLVQQRDEFKALSLTRWLPASQDHTVPRCKRQ
jgi:outer membrane murein-binding lipoprotein Lpp